MVGPIGIDHLELRHGRVALFRIAEIIAAKHKVRYTHGKAHLRMILRDLLMRPLRKASHPLDIGGPVRMKLQAFRQLHGGLAGFHGVNQVIFHRFKLLVRQIPLERNDARGEHAGPLPLGEQGDTLRRGIGALIVLAGQIFRGENAPAGLDREHGGYGIHIRLGEDGAGSTVKISLADPFQIIAVDNADRLKRSNSQILAQVGQHVTRLHIEAGPLFHKKTFYAGHWQNSLSLNHSDIRFFADIDTWFYLTISGKNKKGQNVPSRGAGMKKFCG